MATDDNDLDRDEPTARTKRLELLEMDSLASLRRERSNAKSVKKIKFWMQIFGGVVSATAIATFAAASYLGTLAKASIVDRNTRHIAVIEARLDWMATQMIEIARRVDARVVPLPPPIADAGVDDGR